MMNVPGYDRLRDALQGAYDQAAIGKGAERHANDLPFHEQPMQTLIKGHGIGFATGQIGKKAQESLGMDRDAAIHELRGVINYAAGAIIYLEDSAPKATDAGPNPYFSDPVHQVAPLDFKCREDVSKVKEDIEAEFTRLNWRVQQDGAHESVLKLLKDSPAETTPHCFPSHRTIKKAPGKERWFSLGNEYHRGTTDKYSQAISVYPTKSLAILATLAQHGDVARMTLPPGYGYELSAGWYYVRSGPYETPFGRFKSKKEALAAAITRDFFK